MANKPTQPIFPLGLEAAEQSNLAGIINNGVIEHGPDAVLTLPEGADADGLPSSVRYNSDSDEFEGFYENGGWLPLGGGGIRWEALPHAATTTLVEGRGYLVDNSSAASTVVLPSPTRIGDSVTICDVFGKFSVYPLTIDPNGHPMYGSIEPMTLSTDSVSATFTWSGVNRGWVVTAGVGLGQGRVYSRTIFTETVSSDTTRVTLATNPSIVDVYVDGKRLLESKYTLDGFNVDFSPAIPSGSELQIIQYVPIQLGVGGGGSGGTVITWIYNGGAAAGGETQITLDVDAEDVSEIYVNGFRQQKELGFRYDATSRVVTLADGLEAGDEVVVIINGDPTLYNQIDRTLNEVARSNNVRDNEVILSTNTTQTLNDKKIIYDVIAQKAYALPSLPANVYVGSVSNDKLTYVPGGVIVDLLPLPEQANTEFVEGVKQPSGFGLIGQVESFAALRTTVPTKEGQRIMLAAYYKDSRYGGGEFRARNADLVDDGGVIARVNSNWAWERVYQNGCTVEDFGAYPHTVPVSGNTPVGAQDSSLAFQRMYNSLGRIVVDDSYGVGYLTDAPIFIDKPQYSRVNLRKARIAKVTTTKTGLDEYVAAGGSYVEGNVNCVFMIGFNCRYWEIEGGYVDVHEAPEADRPVPFYVPQAVGYSFHNVLTRGGKYGLWVKNAWLGEMTKCRFSESISHGVYYDSRRYTSTGAAATRGQTATSLSIRSCYAAAAKGDGWHMESAQYINFQAVAMDGAGSVAGGSSYYFDACDVVGDFGSESPSSSAEAYITFVGGSATVCCNTYDTITTPNPVVKVSGGAAVTISLALRTQRTRLFTIEGAGSFVRVPLLTFWDGSTTTPAASLVDPGSYLEILSARDTKGALYYVNGKLQRSNPYTASYDAAPTSLLPLTHKEARIGMAAAGTTLSIPLADLTAVFPNFNRGSNTFVEWLQLSVRNGAGITYGAVFALTAGAVLGSKLDAQVQINNGAAAAVVSSITVSGGNLVITFAGSVGAGAVAILKPV